jgi:hypothetical protein
LKEEELMKFARFLALVVLLLATTSMFAQHVAKGKAKNNDDAAAQQAAADTNSNKLRAPTSEEASELAAGLEKSLSQPTEGLRQSKLGNGITGIDLDGTHENVALAKVNADGTVSTGCVATKKEAEDFLKKSATAKASTAVAKPAPAATPAKPATELEVK